MTCTLVLVICLMNVDTGGISNSAHAVEYTSSSWKALLRRFSSQQSSKSVSHSALSLDDCRSKPLLLVDCGDPVFLSIYVRSASNENHESEFN